MTAKSGLRLDAVQLRKGPPPHYPKVMIICGLERFLTVLNHKGIPVAAVF